jgi:hypothetical protein
LIQHAGKGHLDPVEVRGEPNDTVVYPHLPGNGHADSGNTHVRREVTPHLGNEFGRRAHRIFGIGHALQGEALLAKHFAREGDETHRGCVGLRIDGKDDHVI